MIQSIKLSKNKLQQNGWGFAMPQINVRAQRTAWEKRKSLTQPSSVGAPKNGNPKMSADSRAYLSRLVHTHSRMGHSSRENGGAPPYLMGDKETVSRGWSLTRVRNPNKRMSCTQHSGPSSSERCQSPKSLILLALQV